MTGVNLKNSQICGIKQHIPEQPVGQRRNQRGSEKIPWHKWKCKISKKFMDAVKEVLRRKFKL